MLQNPNNPTKDDAKSKDPVPQAPALDTSTVGTRGGVLGEGVGKLRNLIFRGISTVGVTMVKGTMADFSYTLPDYLNKRRDAGGIVDVEKTLPNGKTLQFTMIVLPKTYPATNLARGTGVLADRNSTLTGTVGSAEGTTIPTIVEAEHGLPMSDSGNAPMMRMLNFKGVGMDKAAMQHMYSGLMHLTGELKSGSRSPDTVLYISRATFDAVAAAVRGARKDKGSNIPQQIQGILKPFGGLEDTGDQRLGDYHKALHTKLRPEDCCDPVDVSELNQKQQAKAHRLNGQARDHIEDVSTLQQAMTQFYATYKAQGGSTMKTFENYYKNNLPPTTATTGSAPALARPANPPKPAPSPNDAENLFNVEVNKAPPDKRSRK